MALRSVLTVLVLLAVRPAWAEPVIVAHRGLLLHSPENTLSNFRACIALRLGFEFDVARTADGHLVCLHDDTVDRTTSGKGHVGQMSLAQLRQLDAGAWFHPRFRGEQVPTIDEVFALIEETKPEGLLFAVDLKITGAKRELVTMARRRGILDNLVFIGRTISDPDLRQTLRKADSAAQGASLAQVSGELSTALAAADATWAYLRFVPTGEEVGQARRADRRTFLAGPTVAGNLPDNWIRASNAGVDAVLTDYPLELRKAVADQPIGR
jgi:glycerophosphoryl diester phosphodiesterase